MADKAKIKIKHCLTAGYIYTGGVTVACLIAAMIPAKLPEKQQIKQMTRTAKTLYLASKDFKLLDDDQKKQVLKDMGGSRGRRGFSRRGMRSMTSETREKIEKNTREVRQQMRKEQMTDFFKLSEAERNKVLDKMIARGLGRGRGNRGGGGDRKSTDNNRKGGGRRRGSVAQRMSRRYEESDSDYRAQRTEFRKLIRARREAAKKK
jgi:hypothetical protein